MSRTIIKTFDKLTTKELYQILSLRSEVFVVEQDCVYQDLDNKDQKALHLYLVKNNHIIAYARIFGPGNYFENASIGRVVVDQYHRKFKLGHHLLRESIKAVKDNFQTNKITISAQEHLEKFYNSHHFSKIGKGYLEDGIPHIEMIYNPEEFVR